MNKKGLMGIIVAIVLALLGNAAKKRQAGNIGASGGGLGGLIGGSAGAGDPGLGGLLGGLGGQQQPGTGKLRDTEGKPVQDV